MLSPSQALLISCLLAVAPGASGAQPRVVEGTVSYVHANGVFLSIGRADGAREGDVAEVHSNEKVIAELRIFEVAEHSSAAKYKERRRWPRPGDRVLVRASAPPRRDVAPLAPRGAFATHEEWREIAPASFVLVPFENHAEPAPALHQARSSARLRSQSWLFLDEGETSVFQRERLSFGLYGPLDEAQRWLVDVAATLDGYVARPEGVRFREDEPVWLDVYRALVAYRPLASLALGVGRLPASSLRFSLVDGAHATLELPQGLRARLGAGFRPDSSSLTPRTTAPAAFVLLDGRRSLGNGFVSYSLDAGWLGYRGTSEAAQMGMSLGLSSKHWWIDADAGTMLLLDTTDAQPTWVADRLCLGSSVNLTDRVAVRLSGRRLEDPALRSEQAVLPASYLTQDAWYESSATLDASFGSIGPAYLSGALTGGSMWGDEDFDRSFMSPSLVMSLARLWRLRVTLAYQLELGWVGGQYGQIGVGVQPLEPLRVDIWERFGVVHFEEPGQLLWTSWTHLRLSLRLNDWLRTGGHARLLAGEAGSGFEVDAYLALHL